VRLATWNVNSVKQRLPRLLAWLDERQPDVVCPQETKLADEAFIAPADADVFDPEAYAGHTHVTAPERAALADLESLGLRDVIRDRWPSERIFTYWDYRAGMFHRDLGMRIDLILAAAPIADRVRAAWVDRKARKGKGPSDHAPVVVDLDEAPDGDVGPVVPPPSRPVTKRGAAKLPQSP
jgi:exodeoxyribonuclease-3